MRVTIQRLAENFQGNIRIGPAQRKALWMLKKMPKTAEPSRKVMGSRTFVRNHTVNDLIRLGLVSIKLNPAKGFVDYDLTKLGLKALRVATVSKKPERKVVPFHRNQSTRKAA